jgi:hypothetical protein
VDKQYEMIPQAVESVSVTATSATTTSSVVESTTTVTNDVTTTFVNDNVGDQISCSLDNPDGCLMCGS